MLMLAVYFLFKLLPCDSLRVQLNPPNLELKEKHAALDRMHSFFVGHAAKEASNGETRVQLGQDTLRMGIHELRAAYAESVAESVKEARRFFALTSGNVSDIPVEQVKNFVKSSLQLTDQRKSDREKHGLESLMKVDDGSEQISSGNFEKKDSASQLQLSQSPQFEEADSIYDEECGDRNNYKCWKKGGHSIDKHQPLRPCVEPTGITNVNPNGACAGSHVVQSGQNCIATCDEADSTERHASPSMLACHDGVFTPATFTCATPSVVATAGHLLGYQGVNIQCSSVSGTFAADSLDPVPSHQYALTAAAGALECAVCYSLGANGPSFRLESAIQMRWCYDASDCCATSTGHRNYDYASSETALGAASSCVETINHGMMTFVLVDHTFPASSAASCP